MHITPGDLDSLVSSAVDSYLQASHGAPPQSIFGIPRGGMPVAYKLAHEFAVRCGEHQCPKVYAAPKDNPLPPKSLVVDDIVDSGATLKKYNHRTTLALIVRDATRAKSDFYGMDLAGSSEWVHFPWDEESGTPEDAVTRLLQFLGYDPSDPSLRETPRRFLSWMEEFRANQPEPEITTFSGVTYDQMVLVKDIPFTSLCEHHLLPFTGTAAVAYIPEHSNVIGLSKIARIVQWRARRLQVQEDLTQEILTEVLSATKCSHVGVIVKAEHSCMSMRGPKAQGHSTITSALQGDFKDDAKTREEFLKLAGV